MMVDGNPLAVRGFNVEGLRRRGFGAERIAAVKQMHRLLYRAGLTFEQARAAIAALAAERPEAAADIALMQRIPRRRDARHRPLRPARCTRRRRVSRWSRAKPRATCSAACCWAA